MKASLFSMQRVAFGFSCLCVQRYQENKHCNQLEVGAMVSMLHKRHEEVSQHLGEEQRKREGRARDTHAWAKCIAHIFEECLS